MNKAILIKKLEKEKGIVYTMTNKELIIEITGLGIVKITLDSDYWLFYNFFKMINNVSDIEL